MGANKKEFEECGERWKEDREFHNIVTKQKGYMSFQHIIKLVSETPNDAELGQKVRKYAANRANE